MEIDLFADIYAEDDAPPAGDDIILEETLRLTESNWGSAQVYDFTHVNCTSELPGMPSIEVTGEKSQDAILRFRGQRVTVLNFASGVMPGGGVRYGARAQEEALCLCSGLLYGLEELLGYYEANLQDGAPKESYDRIIWSEDVPLIRDGDYTLVDPMLMQVITYPAPNNHRTYGTGQDKGMTRAIFQRRCRHVVRHAATMGADVLILGAWGCGEYGNDPKVVAECFKEAIATQSGSIRHVVFACYGPAVNRDAFKKVFG
jgi:uncharacterized protein (TIGR02452 family)